MKRDIDGPEAAYRSHAKPLQRFLDDETLYEIVVNRPGEVLVEGRQGWVRHELVDLTFEKLMNLAKVVASLSDQKIDESCPVLSATLPDGERIQIVIPSAVPAGTVSMTIRKPSQLNLSLSDLRSGGLFDGVRTEAAGKALLAGSVDFTLKEHLNAGRIEEFLALAVEGKKNIIISGATGSGKTTLSKALIEKIPVGERIITIEDTPELVIPQPNNVRLYYSKGGQGRAKVGPKDLLESCLRMRPDRILLQELRDGTAFYYIRNVNSGHPGSITTVHADSAKLAFEQLTLLVKESDGGQDLERDDIRKLLYMLVDVVIQCKRIEGKFRITEIYFEPEFRNSLT